MAADTASVGGGGEGGGLVPVLLDDLPATEGGIGNTAATRTQARAAGPAPPPPSALASPAWQAEPHIICHLKYSAAGKQVRAGTFANTVTGRAPNTAATSTAATSTATAA